MVTLYLAITQQKSVKQHTIYGMSSSSEDLLLSSGVTSRSLQQISTTRKCRISSQSCVFVVGPRHTGR